MTLVEFRLPDVGEGIAEAEIVRWHVSPGDRVRRDEVVVDVETDKSLVELPAPSDGIVTDIRADVGDVVPVGDVLFAFESADTSAEHPGTAVPADASEASQATPARHGGATPAAVAAAEVVTRQLPRRALASPATRRLASQLGVDLATTSGSGPGGRIIKRDVHAAAAVTPPPSQSTAPSPAAEPNGGASSRPRVEHEEMPLRGLRRRIAQNMTLAWQTVPHITDIREIDAKALVSARERLRQHENLRSASFTFLPLFVAAVVMALKSHPKFNASLDIESETVTYHYRYNIGVATATDDGLIVPVVKNADSLSLPTLTRELARILPAARARTLGVEDLTGGTFTITNFGSFGSWIATPIVRPPESAIAGFGRIQDRPVVVGGEVVARPVLPLSMSADHRLIDGHELGAFLNDLSTLLSDPVLLLATA